MCISFALIVIHDNVSDHRAWVNCSLIDTRGGGMSVVVADVIPLLFDGGGGNETLSLFSPCRPERISSRPECSVSEDAAFWGRVRGGQALGGGCGSTYRAFRRHSGL